MISHSVFARLSAVLFTGFELDRALHWQPLLLCFDIGSNEIDVS
jgi:hypothetical protein